MATTLAIKASIRTMVAVYQANVSRAEQSFSELIQAQAALNAVFDLEGSSNVVIYPAGQYVRDGFDWARCERSLRRGAWTAIIERTEIVRVLSPSKAKELRTWLEGELPELTEENVERELTRFAGELPNLFAASVRELFDWLRPREAKRRRSYRSNRADIIGPKVVLEHVLCRHALAAGHFSLDTVAERDRLRAIENIFATLDGQGQRNKRYRSEIEDAIGASWPHGRAETRYFIARAFRNRNIHLRFSRLDLLAQLNRIAGGSTLHR